MNKLNLIDEIIVRIPDELSDLEKIYYIYIRTCQLFRYDTRYIDSPYLIGELIKHNYQNIKNIRQTNVVCSVWSKIYIDLLKKIGIKAKLISRNGHSWVESYLDDMIIYSDPTYGKYTDFSRAKHNSSIHHFFPVTAEKTDKLPIRDSKANFDIDKLNKRIGYIDNEEVFFNMLEERISKMDSLNDKIKCIIANARFVYDDVLSDSEYLINTLRVLLKQDHRNIVYTNLVRVNDDYTFDNKMVISVLENDTYSYYVLDSSILTTTKEEILEYANNGYAMRANYSDIGIDYPLKFECPKYNLKYILSVSRFSNKKIKGYVKSR